MAITHFRASIIQGTRGPVAAAAYRHRAGMYDMAAARTWDYSGAGDLAHAEIALPEDAPGWIAEPAASMPRASLSELLWNAAALAEQRYDAQTAREITIALPSELTRDQNIALVREWVSGELLTSGFAVDWVYHDKPGNPHVHVMHTLRPLEATGFGRKTRVVLDEAGRPVRGADGKLVYARFMGTPDDFKALRNAWGDYVNRHYAQAGLSLRIDMRSYAARGVDMLPGRHLGPALSALRARGYPAEALDAFARDEATREAMLRSNPEIAVDLTAATHATFTRADLAKTIDTFISSPEAFQATLAAAETSTQLVSLTGSGGSSPLYATQRQIDAEASVIDGVRTLSGRTHPALSAGQARNAIAATEAAMSAPGGVSARLSEQQREAFDALMKPTALTAVVGLAGTGKSTLLAAANRGWTAAGCGVHGAALAGIATRGLQTASSIPSRTVASWLAAWDAGTHLLSRGDVFVLDEAGMVGTADMARIVAEVARAGAKLVVVGDPEQLQPIAAGAPFRAITDIVGHATLSDIRRQTHPAMRTATNAFARGDIAVGLKPYMAAGTVHTVATTDDAIADMVEAYVSGLEAGGTQIALAYRNADVRRLNLNIRALLRDTDRLGPGVLYRARDGELEFAVDDRILFLETAKVGTAQVDNGSLGTVVSAARDALTVRLDNGIMVSITPETYAAVSHGYAATIHKSQGATVETAHVLVTSGMDRHKAYVAFSRHRRALAIYAPQDQLGGKDLADVLSRSDPHANALATAFRDRRGIDAAVSEREKTATTLATRRQLVSDAWNRLEDAAALAFARVARPVHLGDVARVRQDLAGVGYLPAVARHLAARMAWAMVHRLSPQAIAHVLTPKGHPLASTVWATLRGAASRSYGRVARTGARGPELTPVRCPAQSWTHTKLDADATHYRLTFGYHEGAVRLAAEAGFAFDKATRTWARPIDAPLPADPVGSRAAIEALLAARAARVSEMALAAQPIRDALKNIGVSWSENRIRLKLPPGNDHLVARISALGGKSASGASGTCIELEAPTRSKSAGLVEALRDIDARVAPPTPVFAAQAMVSPHPGMTVATDGAVLTISAAGMPLRNMILRDLQPVYRPYGTIAVRLDIQQPGAVTGALQKLTDYYSGLLVPPTSPANGIALTEAQLAGWERSPPANLGTAWSRATEGLRMIERHFGRTDRLAETAAAHGMDQGLLGRLQSFTDRVVAARAEVALEHLVRPPAR
jgi:Ti-type conjugative transfer relaxase TraA